MSVRELFLGAKTVLWLGLCVVATSCQSPNVESSEAGTAVERVEGEAQKTKTTTPAELTEPHQEKKSGWLSGLGRQKAAESGAPAISEENLEGPPVAIPGKTAPLDLGTDANVLLAMSFEEAKAQSPQSLVIPPNYKLAADEITVLKKDARGAPLIVSAKGKVFLQIDFEERLIALAQEAYIEAHRESIVRGRPLLKRGKSVIEGLSPYTVYYVRESRLQVIGRHRVLKQEFGYVPSVSGRVGGGGYGGMSGAGSNAPMPMWNVTPNWNQAWQDGPNPLLPALSPQDLPAGMRATPLAPPSEELMDLPPLPNTFEEGVKPEKPAPAPASKPNASTEKAAPAEKQASGDTKKP